MKTKNSLPENIAAITAKKHFTFEDLVEILRFLRCEQGCPWDRAQTHNSIEINLIEEAYELVDAIRKNDPEKMTEEAGDVLLQSLFHAVIGEENGEFTVADVIDGECKKLITRHTHIFGEERAADEQSALVYWEKNKYTEKRLDSAGERVKDVPECLPALLRAEKVQKRAAKFGFEFACADDIKAKIAEEISEFAAATASGDAEAMAEEGGDLLFSVVNLLRFTGVESENALAKSTAKFIERFINTEKLVKADGKQMETLSPIELDRYYNEAKKH